MSDETTDHLDVKRTRALRLRRAAALTVFLCVAAILITLIVHFAMLRRSASRDLAELQGMRQDLQVMVDRIDWTTNQASADKRVVWNMLRQCREAEDIPDLQNDRIFSDHSNTDRVVMYVPAGDHDLEISAFWLPLNRKNPSTTTETKEPELSGEKLWKIPIKGSGGYLLQLSTEPTGGAIEWELTGNHPRFSYAKRRCPVGKFPAQRCLVVIKESWGFPQSNLARLVPVVGGEACQTGCRTVRGPTIWLAAETRL